MLPSLALLLAIIHEAPGRAIPAGHENIPAFSRRYRVGCTRCHISPPKLNAVGRPSG